MAEPSVNGAASPPEFLPARGTGLELEGFLGLNEDVARARLQQATQGAIHARAVS